MHTQWRNLHTGAVIDPVNQTSPWTGAHRGPTEAVTGGYGHEDGHGLDQGNISRLKAFVRVFGLSHAQVAKCAGVSRPAVSRILAGTLAPTPAFWRTLEANLGKLVEHRSGQVFEVEVTQADHAVGRMLDNLGSADSARPA